MDMLTMPFAIDALAKKVSEMLNARAQCSVLAVDCVWAVAQARVRRGGDVN